MSPRYENEVMELSEWLQVKLRVLPPLTLTKIEFQTGTDILAEPYAGLVNAAFNRWLSEKNYELSYNQMCRGFFGAIRALGNLTLT